MGWTVKYFCHHKLKWMEKAEASDEDGMKAYCKKQASVWRTLELQSMELFSKCLISCGLDSDQYLKI
jgi:hypothetical protein